MLTAATLSAQSADGVKLGSVTLKVTSGTMEIQNVRASGAVFEEQTGQVSVREIELLTNYRNSPPIRAKSPMGTVMVGGLPAPGSEAREQSISFDEVMDYGENFATMAVKGDIMLSGNGESAEAEMGDVGSVIADKMIWSELYKRIVLPSTFSQSATLEDGTKMEISGQGLYVDPQLKNWTYFAGEDEPGRIRFERPSTDTPEN
jgi:hypothetical protein